MQPQFIYKIYDLDGTTFLTQLEPKKILNDTVFSSEINGGQGEIRINYNTEWDNPPSEIAVGNIIRVSEITLTNGVQTERLIYTGVISQFTPTLTSQREFVEIRCLGLASMLSFALFKSGADFTPSFAAAKISQIFKNVIDHFVTIHGALLSYDAGSIPDTTAVLTYTFEYKKHSEVLQKAFESVQDTHFWRVGADGKVYLKALPTVATHSFTIGKEIYEARGTKTGEDLINGFLLKGDGVVGEVFKEDATSKSNHGVHQEFLDDSNYTDATEANARAQSEIDAAKDLKNAPQLIIGNFDIGSILAGESCRIQNLKKGSSIFSENMLINRVDYATTTARLHLEIQRSTIKTAFKNL